MARIIGDKALNAKLAKMARGVDVTEALLRGANAARDHYVESIQDNADGRVEIRYSPRREVHVSAPGQSPNTDTGFLVGSTGVESSSRNQAEAFASADYAEYLEFGTEKMAPRPAMGPAFDATKAGVIRDVAEAIRGKRK